MDYAVPAYLIGIGIGDLKYHAFDKRSGVWAEPHLIEKAAMKFASVPKLMKAGERLFGKYPFGRYDLLILPRSFPYGGMENPCLTFLTHLLLDMDHAACNRLVGHELAHSWTGNLVTNHTWRDFWLNEGWTSYAEWRLLEVIEGRNVANLFISIGLRDLGRAFKRWYDLGRPHMAMLAPDVANMDPDDVLSRIPYVKGAMFLLTLEKLLGRKVFDVFVRKYIRRFRFKTIRTAEFLTFASENLRVGTLEKVGAWDWIYEPDLPVNAPKITSPLVDAVVKYAKAGTVPTERNAGNWVGAQWQLYFELMRRPTSLTKLRELNGRFGLATAVHPNVRWAYLLLAVESGHEQIFRDELEELLTTCGQLTYLKTLYGGLCKTAAGKVQARRLFKKARASYHPIGAGMALTAMREAGLQIK